MEAAERDGPVFCGGLPGHSSDCLPGGAGTEMLREELFAGRKKKKDKKKGVRIQEKKRAQDDGLRNMAMA